MSRPLDDGTFLSIWVDAETKRWLRMQAARHEMSISEYMRSVIAEHRASGTIVLEKGTP